MAESVSLEWKNSETIHVKEWWGKENWYFLKSLPHPEEKPFHPSGCLFNY